MHLEPGDLYEKLEFDKVLELLSKECLGELGVEQVQNLTLETVPLIISRKLKEVAAYQLSIEENDHFPLQVYEDLSKDLRMLEVIDFVLPVDGLQRINQVMRIMKAVLKFFTTSRKEIYASLFDIVREVNLDETLMEAIDKVIDEKGDIRPNASPELAIIDRRIKSKMQELDKVFRRLIGDYRKKGWLSENVESFRNGRRVLSVPAEHKRKIRGIIHDESASGKTAFIEPEAIIEINNDIFDYENEYKREVYRILKDLSTTLRPYGPQFAIFLDIIVYLDVVRAKAQLAVRMNANMPKLKEGAFLGLQTAYHPLLFLKNKQLGKKTVPFDLHLIGPNRVLVLSGPNAGGKSISMKTVGLCQLMLQAGMLIPVDEQSEMGIFEKIFADIGDQQSIEDDLSTYSSRLKNMRVFLENADPKTLLLIDEFGSGTDPKIGGAIAEAILREMNFRKVYGIITTHYSNLKIFAFKTKGIVNGAMTFDKETLSPTYEMKVGRPGSSFAFEIAQKSGLSGKVLKYARHRTGANEKAVDELLIDLQREKKEVEERLEKMDGQQKQLDKLIKNYERLHRELEFQRKKFKLEAKEQNLQQTARENKKLEKLIREIKEEKNLEKAKELAAKVRTERKELNESVSDLREDIYTKTPSKTQKPIEVGDFVRLRSGGAAGKVESINKNKAIVLLGALKMTANLRDLVPANEPLDIRSSRSIQADMLTEAPKFESKIDLRGLRKDEALRILESFVDKALLNSTTNLHIIHGKGNGVLRNAVKQKLREYDAIQKVWHPEPEFGGDGATYAAF